MSKKLKWVAVISGSSVLVFGLLIFIFLSLPADGNSKKKPMTYVKESQDQVAKINVPSNIKEEGDRFVQSFFTFNLEQFQKNSEYSLAYEACRKLAEENGQGKVTQKKLMDATTDSYGNHLLTYTISGVYKKKKKDFSIVLTLTNHNGTVRVSNYSVVNDE